MSPGPPAVLNDISNGRSGAFCFFKRRPQVFHKDVKKDVLGPCVLLKDVPRTLCFPERCSERRSGTMCFSERRCISKENRILQSMIFLLKCNVFRKTHGPRASFGTSFRKTEGPGDVFQENTWSQNILWGVCLEHFGSPFRNLQEFSSFFGDIFQKTQGLILVFQDVCREKILYLLSGPKRILEPSGDL